MHEDRWSQDEPMWHVWYRYLWPFPYFRNALAGSPLERRQNYRHNRAMRIHLPGFALKWLLLSAACFNFGGYLETQLELIIPAAGFFVGATWALLVAVVLSVCWAWLTRFPELG
jgi:hypothetical protein